MPGFTSSTCLRASRWRPWRRRRQAGVEITCEATPHHLTLTDEAVRSLDARFKMNPPLRSEDDRQALIDGLRSGVIDCVATDHAPHSVDEKEVPFEEAAMGVTGLETAFSVLHTDLVVPGVLELAVLVDRMSAGAAPFGLEPPGLAPGCEANLVLFDPEAEWEAGAEGWESRSDNSCFAGRGLRGRVLMTVVGRPGRLPPAQLRDGGRVSAPKLDPERAALVVIDVQEGFRKAVPSFDQVARATAALVKGAKAVGIPIVVTEQYPKGLGKTVPEVAEELPEGVAPIEKVCFSAPEAEGFDLAGRDQALVCGIEAHVCVNQTALDLLDEGVEVQVVARRGGLALRREPRDRPGQGRARRGGDHQRRDGAVRARRARRDRRVQAGAEGSVLDFAPNPS